MTFSAQNLKSACRLAEWGKRARCPNEESLSTFHLSPSLLFFLFRLVYLNRCNTPHNVNDITTSHDHTRFPAATLSLPAGPYLHYPLGPEKRASMHSPRTALLSSSTASSLHINTHILLHTNASTRYHSIILSRTVLWSLVLTFSSR